MQYLVRIVGFMMCGLLLTALPGCSSWFGERNAYVDAGLVVVNVLDKAAYDDCHIKGSINVPFEQLTEYAKQWNPEKTSVVLYCSNYMCSSSEYAYHQLHRMGFKNVFVYPGGTAEWYQKGLSVEGPCAASYLKQEIAPHTDSSVRSMTAQELATQIEERIVSKKH